MVVFHSNSVGHLLLHILLKKTSFYLFYPWGVYNKETKLFGMEKSNTKKSEGFVTPTKELYEKVYEMFGDVCEVKCIPFIIYPRNIV